MTWRGVPFEALNSVSDHLSVSLSTIPKIVLDTPTDLTGPVLTAFAALIGGLIPAFIAWRTFQRNVQVLQSEREAQHTFLKQERIEQHKSLAADRQTQIDIASKNFNMQVLSANRQDWINEFRELISLYCMTAQKFFDAEFFSRLQSESYEEQINLHKKYPSPAQALELEKAEEKYSKVIQNRHELRGEIELLIFKIRLLLNPLDVETKDIIAKVYGVRSTASNMGSPNMNYNENYPVLCKIIDELVACTQKLLKAEWERVKMGE